MTVPGCPRTPCACCSILSPCERIFPTEYGINLMACFFLVHHHGGRIQAANAGEKGTVFTIQLPLEPGEAGPPAVMTDTEFLRKSVFNQNLWEKLVSS